MSNALRRAFSWTPLSKYVRRVEVGSQMQRDRIADVTPDREGTLFLRKVFDENHISAKVAAYLGGR